MPLASIYTPSKQKKKQRFSDVFRGHCKLPVKENGLNVFMERKKNI